jgi:PAS domain S-box-containing protein/diguanylate cyclase (GGDEF)-like protein
MAFPGPRRRAGGRRDRARTPEPRACDERLLQLAGQLGELLGRAFERDEAAVALRAGEERFRMMFEHAPIAMCLTSFSGATKGQLMDANQALCDLLGLPRDELVGRTFSSITSPGSDLDAARDVYEAVDAGATVSTSARATCTSGGDPVPCHVVATIVRDAAGLPLYSVTQIRDIRAELAEREALSHQALHDPLTGLANRRMLDARLGPIVAAARRSGRSTSAFVVDLDGLKATNDRSAMTPATPPSSPPAPPSSVCLRPEDLVVRIGGDEFVALVAGSPVAPWRTARSTGAGRRRLVAPIPRTGGISASSGWAVDDGVVVPDLLIGRADARMYQRKRAKARVAAR